MIVVDASVLLEVLLRTPAAAPLESRLFARRQTLHAPHLVDLTQRQAKAGGMGRWTRGGPATRLRPAIE